MFQSRCSLLWKTEIKECVYELIEEGESVNLFLLKIYPVDDDKDEVDVFVNEAVRNNESVVI